MSERKIVVVLELFGKNEILQPLLQVYWNIPACNGKVNCDGIFSQTNSWLCMFQDMFTWIDEFKVCKEGNGSLHIHERTNDSCSYPFPWFCIQWSMLPGILFIPFFVYFITGVRCSVLKCLTEIFFHYFNRFQFLKEFGMENVRCLNFDFVCICYTFKTIFKQKMYCNMQIHHFIHMFSFVSKQKITSTSLLPLPTLSLSPLIYFCYFRRKFPFILFIVLHSPLHFLKTENDYYVQFSI